MSRSPSRAARVCALAVILTLLAVVPSAARPVSTTPSLQPPAWTRQAQDTPLPPLLLQTGTVAPSEANAWGAGATPDAQSAEPGPGYYIVQFRGPVQEAWKTQVAELGGTVLDYIPEFAFVVYMDAGGLAPVGQLDFVAWTGRYLPEYKSTKALRAAVAAGEVRELIVQTFPNAALATTIARVRAQGAEVADATANELGGILRVRLDAAQLDRLAALAEVRWIEPWRERKLYNDIARSSQALNAEWAWSSQGLYGQNQIVAVSDTGLDTGSTSTLAQDFLGSPTGCTGTGRIVATYALGRSGNWSDSCRASGVNEGGHGTHVAGSILGNGCRSGSTGNPNYSGSYAGMAPQAKLVMQSVMDSSCGLNGLPADLNTLYSQARTAGARIHSNSWGADNSGGYDTDGVNTDLFTWNNKDYLILFAAGNAGTDTSPANGFIDQGSVGTPGTAKNVVTVGASENNRSTGGYNAGGACSTWGGCWPSDYATEPIKSDALSNNVNGMVAFSSRGPAADGRIKPDVVAPGSNILSTKSQGQYVSGGWGAGPNSYYQYMGGTSMATPLTAGAATLIRQFYTDKKSITPSAALLKATLINSAVNLYPGQYASPAEQNPSRPNMAQGWGRVNVANATDDTHLWQDISDANGLATGGSQSYSYATCTSSPLKVTLVWTDYPGTASAAKELVNDLDLAVTAPDGTVYKGNVFTNGWSAAGGSADRVNNVESVYFQSAGTGNWTVTVSGYNVPNGASGKQGYALVVDNASNSCSEFTVAATPATQSVCAPANATYTINLSMVGTFNSAVTLSASGNPANTTATFNPNPVTPPGSSTLTIGNTGAAAAGSYSIMISGQGGVLTHSTTVALNLSATQPAAATLSAPLDGSTGQALTPTFTWGAASDASSYDIDVASDPVFATVVASASSLTSTSYTPGSNLSADTVYYWRVTAKNGCGNKRSAVAAFRTVGSATQSFCRNLSLAIPDANTTGLTDSQTIATSGTLTDVNISVQTTHTWVGDLIYKVTNAGTGTAVTIIDRPGYPGSSTGCANNHIRATLDDQAAGGAVESQCATSTATTPPPYAIDGTFTPNNALSAFNGQQLANTWRLNVSDTVSSDTGTLTQWCVIATYSSATSADYSDLAAGYGVAWHTGGGTPRLGSQWTADSGFDNGADNASDDGVTLAGNANWGAGTGAVDANASAASCLNAWMDFTDGTGVGPAGPGGANGSFGESYGGVSEWVVQNRPVNSGANNVTFTVPSGLLGGGTANYNMRFRLTPRDGSNGCTGTGYLGATPAGAEFGAAGAEFGAADTLAPLATPSPYGSASGGEDEDFTFGFSPLAARLAGFGAELVDGRPVLTWETVSEQDNAGFNVYRGASENGPWVKANDSLISAAAPGSSEGRVYRWTDPNPAPSGVRQDGAQWYLLEDVDLSGAATQHGPVQVGLDAPTAVTIGGFSARVDWAQFDWDGLLREWLGVR